MRLQVTGAVLDCLGVSINEICRGATAKLIRQYQHRGMGKPPRFRFFFPPAPARFPTATNAVPSATFLNLIEQRIIDELLTNNIINF